MHSFHTLCILIHPSQGVEVLIGPSPNSRTSAGLGDTRIFLTANVDPAGIFTGFAYAIRPKSPAVNGTYLRTQDIFGNYTGKLANGVIIVLFCNWSQVLIFAQRL